MKFGVLQFFSWPGRRNPLEVVYDRAFDRIRMMDECGYDAVWLAEHHFSTYSVCPSVHMMGTHIAAHTKNIRIGTAVSLASFYHPLRLAEEVALLDQLSNGRVNWGAGRGFDPTEHRIFGVEPSESYPRFREAIDIVLTAWQNDKFSYEGQFWNFQDVEVLPKPRQKPMPVWVAASSENALDWAGEEGYSIMMDPHATFEELAGKRSYYRNKLSASGHPTNGHDIPMARTLAMAETSSEATEVGRRGAEFMFGSYLRKKENIYGKDAGGEKIMQMDALNKTIREGGDPVAKYVDEVAICGDPIKVVDKLQELEETVPLEYLMVAPLSHGSFVTFTEKVMPKFL